MDKKILDRIVMVFALVGIAYHFISTQYLFHGALEHEDFHLGFSLILIFLVSLQNSRSRGRSQLYVILALASLIVAAYIKIRYPHLEDSVGLPDTIDVIVGVVLIITVIEASRESWGLTIPIISIVSIAYYVFGHHIPGALGHTEEALDTIVSRLGIGFSGIFGTFMSISANFIFPFLIFGGIMGAAGVVDFVLELGKLLGRVLSGGPAHTAVLGSGMIGTVTGAAVANVVLTGVFTIPMMKKAGYRPEWAGAIEATASTGSQLMPPIMGASAFLMAAFIGIPYRDVMVAAIIPALFYYFFAAAGVQVIAWKYDLKPPQEKINPRVMITKGILFIIPIIVIFILLLMRFSPSYAAFYAVVSLLALIGLFSLTRIMKGEKPLITLHQLMDGFIDGAIAGAKIAVLLGCVGIISQTLYSTAIGVKLTGVVEAWAGDSLFLLLVMTMVVSLFLGCGVPTVGAYVLVSIIVIPVLVRAGLLEIQAHFFAFYFAIISAVTPPVAVAAMAGAGIAGAGYWKTALVAFRLALGGFTLPFFIAYNPFFLLHGGAKGAGAMSVVAAMVCITCLIAIVYYHLLRPLHLLELPLCILGVLGSGGYIFVGGYHLFAIGAFSITLFLISQWRRKAAFARYLLN